MKNIATTIAYASAWIATSIAVILQLNIHDLPSGVFGCYYFLFALKLVLIFSTSNEGDDSEEE